MASENDSAHENIESKNYIQGAAVVFGSFPKLASAVLGFVSIGYCIGWWYAFVYFHEIGAPWMIDLVSPIKFLTYGAPMALVFCLGGCVSFTRLSVGEVKKSSFIVSKLRPVFFWVSFAFLLNFHFFENGFGGRWPLFFGYFSAVVLLCIAGAYFVDIIKIISEKRDELGLKRLSAVMVVVGVFIATVSFWAGESGKSFIRQKGSDLSGVEISGNVKGDWKIVQIAGNFVLICKFGMEKEPVYRIVSFSEIEKIYVASRFVSI